MTNITVKAKDSESERELFKCARAISRAARKIALNLPSDQIKQLSDLQESVEQKTNELNFLKQEVDHKISQLFKGRNGSI